MPSVDMSGEFGGFDILSAGFHHVFVVETNDAPISKRDKKLLDGGELTLSALEGTPRTNGVYTDKGRLHKQYFPMPNPTHKDEGKMARCKLTNLIIACGLATEADREKAINFEWEQMKHKQFVIKIANSVEKGNDGKEYTNADVDGVHIYNVTDPRVAHVPKCGKSLAYLGYELAADGKTVTVKGGQAAGGSGNGNGAASPATAGVGATSEPAATDDISLDDL